LWLTSWERRGLVLLVVALVGLGGLVEKRSAFLHQRMGDLEVFLRAAWAVRTGHDIYTITDSKGFHYHYPPLFAILLVPLADPPPTADRSWALPYPVTVAAWYCLNLLFLAAAIHCLAGVLERTLPGPAGRQLPRGCRRWWALRLVPVLACMPAVGHTLMRGQVGLLLLLLLCGMAAALVRGRRLQAGLWLAGAICLKVIPAFLILYPLYRRDVRCLAGCAVGLVVGLGVVPAAVFGPAQTLAYAEEWMDVLVRPVLGKGTDQSRAKELIEATATDSQSLPTVLHNLRYPDRLTRPAHTSAGVRWVHRLGGVLLTALTFLAGRTRAPGDAPATVLEFGALVMVTLLVSPVCHLHYFCLSVLLVMGLLAAAWEGKETPHLGPGMWLVGAVNIVANSLPHIPGLEPLRDGGLAMSAGLLLWFLAILALRKRAQEPGSRSSEGRLAAA
jgi:hypothetical protein